ncbi:catechol 2,3-dioxygenase-like lactoylglutathione lyase family enzyme [Stackebrandtia albiflava]|uniref:Catechol 2,3-dioxygenase-like lactoylglutathione lyase family enzyme n=1 Tax=Stackebrandtia albiflava TaxID=406432 RepID=A0A562V1I5_9ACTN|nr:VOC family protein [Stackebrandtia albiflava]TWJ11776.1 catechol 2,3-dioxygenase-like lactoylglutathione lyase family enzyme [Stackebrandtia albiflava]
MKWAIEVIPIPVTDVTAAVEFYTAKVGFTLDLEVDLGNGRRAVQLTPPGSACSIVLGSGSDAAPGSVRGVQIVVEDVEAARRGLAERGVDVSPVRHFEAGEWRDGPGGTWNSWVFFDDPDGNGWALQERAPG